MIAEPNPSGRAPTGVAETAELPLMERLRNRLLLLIGDLEEGELPPTEMATARCEQILAATADQIPAGQRLPFPHLSSGGQGDLSCEWRSDERLVLLFISAQAESCLYEMELGGTPVVTQKTTQSPSVEAVVAALNWFEH